MVGDLSPESSDVERLAEQARGSSDRMTQDAQQTQDDRSARATRQMDLTSRAIKEGELLGAADKVVDEQRREFWDFQNRVNSE